MAGLNERVFRSNSRPVRVRGVTTVVTFKSGLRGDDDNDSGVIEGTCLRGVDATDDEETCWTAGLCELFSLLLPPPPLGVDVANGGGPNN